MTKKKTPPVIEEGQTIFVKRGTRKNWILDSTRRNAWKIKKKLLKFLEIQSGIKTRLKE